MTSIEYGTYKQSFPSSWNELTTRQLLFIAARWRKWVDYMKMNADLSKEGIVLVKLFMGVFSINPFNEGRKIFYKLNRVQMHALIKKVDFILYSPALTKNMLPTIKVGGKTYYGPEDGLKNICLHEFAFADSFITNYGKSRDENDLDTAIAVLYRPAIDVNSSEYAGDIRGKFKKHLVEVHQKQLRELPYEYKQAIYLWYRGCRDAIEKRYPRVFNGEKQDGPDFGWLGIIQELAGDKFGTYDETGYWPAYDILHYCEKNAYQAEQNLMKKKND